MATRVYWVQCKGGHSKVTQRSPDQSECGSSHTGTANIEECTDHVGLDVDAVDVSTSLVGGGRQHHSGRGGYNCYTRVSAGKHRIGSKN